MGLFDMSGGGNMGYANVKNTKNFTNEDLLQKLSAITVSFGTPVMGDIKGTQSVLYKKVSDQYDVFVRVDKDKVIMGKIGTDGVGGGKMALNMGLDMFLGHKDKGTSDADRAVDELLEVIKKLESGEEVTGSTVAQPTNTATGSAIELFMKQKAISLKPKFDIFDMNETPVYHIEGDMPRLNFSIQKNGTEKLKLKKKLVAIMPEYTILQGGSECAKIKKKLKFAKPELNGTVNGKELKIVGDILGFDFDIQVGGATIGHIDIARTVWSDCYRISIKDESMEAFVVALAIIVDNIADKDND
ncbi:MAG: hypothetical protein IKO61_09875 [Lachnospiraceae bacterium]|nr:hypothetical protein [Lachnospiraceae bacterium]